MGTVLQSHLVVQVLLIAPEGKTHILTMADIEETPVAVEEQQPTEEGTEGVPAECEEPAVLPPKPKQKPVYFVHWDRKKSRFYDYNYDYGMNYYSSMVNHLDTRTEIPSRRAFADRAIRSSIDRKTLPDRRTENLLAQVDKAIKNFENSQKNYLALAV